MKEQNFANHTRLVTGYHYITCTAILTLLTGAFVNLYRSSADNLYSASLLCLASLVLASFAWYIRIFALRAQDRAIRAEENLRYFILTGKPFPAELRMGQIIALRFAPDAELPGLVSRAITENLRSREIKAAIQNWKADHYRV